MKNEVIILGTGTSTGTPQLGCNCTVCTSNDLRDTRLRTSLLLKTKEKKTIVIDTTPDMRTQLLKHKVMSVDGCLITHDHADHLHGIDDLRPYCFGPPLKVIPVVASTKISNLLKDRFPYIFNATKLFGDDRPILGGGIPHLNLQAEELSKKKTNSINCCGEILELFNLPHGHTTTTGMYHEGLCYIPDCTSIADELVLELSQKKIDLLIIDCLQEDHHETHLNVEQAFNYIEKIAPKRAGLIHMNHETSHERLVKLARIRFPDGLVFPLVDNDRFEY
ncbi:MAG: MBL fold metallo-hydrolase [Bacteriovoracaceae bacterium]|nr:MBL fold metallo-hydrolase [Bacteriovoracaceae bacterium]